MGISVIQSHVPQFWEGFPTYMGDHASNKMMVKFLWGKKCQRYVG